MKIKTAELTDSKVVYEITKQAFQDYLDPAFSSYVAALQETEAEVKEDIQEKEVLLAYIDGQPVGSVRFYPLENGDYHLSRLGVVADHQGQQIGYKLIEEVERRVKKRGGERIILYSAYQRQELLDFYQRYGYEIKTVTDDDDYRRAKLVKQLTVDSGYGFYGYHS